MAFSLLTPEYFKALRLQYYVLGTTGLDKTLVHQFSHEALPKVLAFPLNLPALSQGCPAWSGSAEPSARRERRSCRSQWKHTL